MAGVVKRDCEDSILAKIAITQKKDPGGPFFRSMPMAAAMPGLSDFVGLLQTE